MKHLVFWGLTLLPTSSQLQHLTSSQSFYYLSTSNSFLPISISFFVFSFLPGSIHRSFISKDLLRIWVIILKTTLVGERKKGRMVNFIGFLSNRIYSFVDHLFCIWRSFVWDLILVTWGFWSSLVVKKFCTRIKPLKESEFQTNSWGMLRNESIDSL